MSSRREGEGGRPIAQCPSETVHASLPLLKISQFAEQHIFLRRIPSPYNLPLLLLLWDGAMSAYRVKWMTVFTAGVVVNAY